MTSNLLILYFVSLGVCSFSTIYKTSCLNNMKCRQIIGNMFWSLIPVMNTFKAMLWLISLAVDLVRKLREAKP